MPNSEGGKIIMTGGAEDPLHAVFHDGVLATVSEKNESAPSAAPHFRPGLGPQKTQLSMMKADLSDPPKIVLEIGGNPMGSRVLAMTMVRAASKTGAWGVKFQAYKVKSFIHKDNPVRAELLGEEMDFALLEELIDYARSLSLNAGVTVFGPEGIELAKKKKAGFIKISSGDLNHLGLIRLASRSGLPLVLSTGASSQADIDRALSVLSSPPLALLQCTSLYPCPPGEANLALIAAWRRLGLPAGF